MHELCAQVLLSDGPAAQALLDLLRSAGVDTTPATRGSAPPDLVFADVAHLGDARSAAPGARLVGVVDGTPRGAARIGAECDASIDLSAPPQEQRACVADLVRSAKARRDPPTCAPPTRWDGARIEAVGSVVGGIAHDFNNLLMTILANAKLIERDLPGDSGLLRPLGHLTAAARRAATLTDQLLAFAGRRHRDPTCVDVDEILRKIEPELRDLLPPHASLELDLAGDLPCIDADRHQLSQMVRDLVRNSADALVDGSGRVQIRTSAVEMDRAPAGALAAHEAPPGTYVTLDVTDDGHGILPEHLPRVFDPFFTTRANARGLGLAATMGTVRAHHGAIELDSHVGRGTTLRVMLPVAPDPARELSQAGVPVVSDQPGVTVLIADDDPQLRQALERLLKQFDFHVLTATNGHEALEQLQAHTDALDVALIDLAMPELGGVATLDQIRALAPALPVIFMSGIHDPAAQRVIEDDPNTEFLLKPFDPLQLVHRFGELAHRERRRSPLG